MTINDDELSKNAPVYGLSFEEAIKSTPEIWKKRMEDENYEGDTNNAGHLMAKLCEGVGYGQKMLKERQFKENGKPLPRVDFGYIPQVPGIIHADAVNTIIVPNHYLKIYEGYEPDTMVEMVDAVDGKTVQFKGSIEEYWFLTGVEEYVHSVDPEIPTDVIPVNVPTDTITYHSQDHEYKALAWQVRAAIDNDFSEEAIDSSRKLLKQCTERRKSQGDKPISQ